MSTIPRYHPAHPKHRHHSIWREYTEALLSGEFPAVEMRTSKGEDCVKLVTGALFWEESFQYRIAPKLVRVVIGDVENWCPEPDGGMFFPTLYGDLVSMRVYEDFGYSTYEKAEYVSRALRGEKLPPWGEA